MTFKFTVLNQTDHTGGNEALWFKNGRWIMSNRANLGQDTDYNGLHSAKTNASCPNSPGLEWKYWDNDKIFLDDKFIDAGSDIKVIPDLEPEKE